MVGIVAGRSFETGTGVPAIKLKGGRVRAVRRPRAR